MGGEENTLDVEVFQMSSQLGPGCACPVDSYTYQHISALLLRMSEL